MRLDPRLDPPCEAAPLGARLGWLALYWLGGVVLLGTVAMILRAAIP